EGVRAERELRRVDPRFVVLDPQTFGFLARDVDHPPGNVEADDLPLPHPSGSAEAWLARPGGDVQYKVPVLESGQGEHPFPDRSQPSHEMNVPLLPPRGDQFPVFELLIPLLVSSAYSALQSCTNFI